jgi:hypothetical protein
VSFLPCCFSFYYHADAVAIKLALRQNRLKAITLQLVRMNVVCIPLRRCTRRQRTRKSENFIIKIKISIATLMKIVSKYKFRRTFLLSLVINWMHYDYSCRQARMKRARTCFCWLAILVPSEHFLLRGYGVHSSHAARCASTHRSVLLYMGSRIGRTAWSTTHRVRGRQMELTDRYNAS